MAVGLETARFATRSGGSVVMLHHPARGAYARLEPRDVELLPLMDGTHSVAELVIADYQRHGVLALARVASLVELLRSQGFLLPATRTSDAYAELSARLRPAPGRWPSRLSNMLRGGELRWDGIDDALGAAYAAWGRRFFSTPWLVIGIGLGALLLVLLGVELGRGRYNLDTFGAPPPLNLLLLALLGVLAMAIHELGHGLAVKHAGRHVRCAGVRLEWCLPVASVDTTDVWLASPRQRRLTAFAGPWTGLALGGLCAIGAFALPTGPAGALLFVAGCVFLLGSLITLNPLLELDGYDLLVDLLDVPLLRARALSFVLGPLWRKLWRRQRLSPRERLFALFGLGALVYSAVAIVLAVRVWQALLLPASVAGLASPQLLPRLGALLLIGVLAVPLGVWGWAALRRVLPSLRLGWGRLRARAEFRHQHAALAAVRAVPFLAALPAARLLELARAAQLSDLKAGAEVVRQGEWGQRLCVIVHGACAVLVDGQPPLRLGPGEYFGEWAPLDGAPRAATVVATEDSRLLSLGQDVFEALLANDLAARARLSRALAHRAEVAAMPLFAGLAPADLDRLVSRLVPEQVAAGLVVIRQGELGQRFRIVRRGRVQLTRDGAVLAELGAGEAFGEMALLREAPHPATVTALEPTHLLALEAADFHNLLAAYLRQGAGVKAVNSPSPEDRGRGTGGGG